MAKKDRTSENKVRIVKSDITSETSITKHPLPNGLNKYFTAALNKLDSLEYGDPSDYLRKKHNIIVGKTKLSSIWVSPKFKKYDGKKNDILFEEFINNPSPQLVLADPGCGKSTLSRFLTCDFIKKYKTNEQDYFGIFVPLSIFKKPVGAIEEDIAFCAAEFVGLEKDKEVLEELKANILQACIIFDGYDELPSSRMDKDNPIAIRSEVAAFISLIETNADISSDGEKKQRFIILCRKIDYEGYHENSKLSIDTLLMTEFNAEQMNRAIVNWHSAAIEKIKSSNSNHSVMPNISLRQTEILSTLRDHSDLAEICLTPFMLNAFQTVDMETKDLPSSVSQLCWRAILWFFIDKHFEHDTADLVNEYKACILSSIIEIGSQIHEREVQNKITRFTKLELRAIVEKSFKINGLDKTLEQIDFEQGITKVHLFLMRGHGILVNRSCNEDLEFDFVHNVFREVAAGRWLLNKNVPELTVYALKAEWHGPIKYWAGFKAIEPDGHYKIDSLVEQLSQHQYQENTVAILACAEMLVEVIYCVSASDFPEGLKNHINDISEKLCKLIKQDNLLLAHRIRIGDLLSIVGDPRISVPIVERLTLIESGDYKIGRSENHKTTISKKYESCPASPIIEGKLSKYRIGNYLVTNKEFGEFIKANGYKESKYWKSEIGLKWVQGDEETFIYLIDEAIKIGRLHLTSELAANRILATQIEERCVQTVRRTLPMYWSDPAYNRPNQPIVGINFWEASAYCNWLEDTLKNSGAINSSESIRLPIEAEWETAARLCGEPYPWKNGEPLNCALIKSSFTRESEAPILKPQVRPCSVGLFEFVENNLPLFDIVGNVWEWTASKIDLYSQNSFKQELFIDGLENRMARGSSWFSSEEESSQITFRSFDPPYFAYEDLGFRIVIF